MTVAKGRYRLHRSNAHFYCFRSVGYPAEPDYLVPRHVWARWLRGDYP